LHRVNQRDAFNGDPLAPVSISADSLETLVSVSGVAERLANKEYDIRGPVVDASHGVRMSCKDQAVTVIEPLSKLS
jgi:hypothetical protein